MSHKALVRQAAVSHFQSKMEEAKLRMRVYEEPVGVGEHSYVLAEYLQAVKVASFSFGVRQARARART